MFWYYLCYVWSSHVSITSWRAHYKKCCSLWRAIFVIDHRKFVIKQHLWRNLKRSCIERHGSLLVTSLSFRHRLTWSMTIWSRHRTV
jgi:hypothetical protein